MVEDEVEDNDEVEVIKVATDTKGPTQVKHEILYRVCMRQGRKCMGILGQVCVACQRLKSKCEKLKGQGGKSAGMKAVLDTKGKSLGAW